MNAPNSAALCLSLSIRSGCHCTRSPNRPSVNSMASIRPSALRAVTFSPLPTSLAAWWWLELTRIFQPGNISARCEPGSMRIVLDRERCVGCGKCVDACPFDGVSFDQEASLPLICDLCDGDPACVDACALPGAIRYESVSRDDYKEKTE